MSIEKLIGELTDEVVSLRKIMIENVAIMTLMMEKASGAAAGTAAAPKARASRAKKEDAAPAETEKETVSRGRGRDDDDRDGDRGRGSDRERDRDDDNRGRGRDAERSRGDKDDDDRRSGSGNRDREPSKSTDPYELIKDFLNYGDEDNKDDEAERDLRTDFLDDIFKFLGVKKAKDVPEKEGKNLKRWFAIYEDKGPRHVDFDRD